MQSWGLTDPGCVRKQNQDAYRIEQLDRETLLCVVCDGMGGAKSGNIASTLAVEVFVEEIRRSWVSGMESDRVDQMLRSAVKLANFTVYDQSAQFEEFDGMVRPLWRRWCGKTRLRWSMWATAGPTESTAQVFTRSRKTTLWCR